MVLGWVLGPPRVVFLVLGSPLVFGLDFCSGSVVLLSAGDVGGVAMEVILSWRAAGWGLVQVSCGVVVFVLGTSSSAGPGSSDHSVHLAL